MISMGSSQGERAYIRGSGNIISRPYLIFIAGTLDCCGAAKWYMNRAPAEYQHARAMQLDVDKSILP